MAKQRKSGAFIVILTCVFAVGVFSLISRPLKAEAAASLYLSPPSGTFILGNTFTVSLYVNTGGQAINAVEADLSFPPEKLQIVSPTTGKSFIQVWVSQPSYSNEKGTIKFQGTVPTPGINTDAGLISTITFRVKSPGTAAVRILDTSRVLLNDGRGTDILGQTTDGIYYLTLPPPEGPIVTSRTNPDQEKWYNTDKLVFEWDAPPDIQGYSYILDQDPAGEPDDISEGTSTRVVYSNLADGTYYFHIKSLRQGAWGGITDYVAKIDRTPPAAFKINFSPDATTSNHRPIIDFATTDAASGIDHYELKIVPLDLPLAYTGQNQTPFFIEVTPPYSRNLDDGRYEVVVRASDRAGNYYQAQSKLEIAEPLFEIISDKGVRISGVYTLAWPYVGLSAAVLLILFGFLARLTWRWHRQVEEHLQAGVLSHPDIAEKLAELKSKQSEYGKQGLKVIFILFILGLGLLAGRQVFAAETAATQSLVQPPVEPPIVTLFPRSLSNDEIFYIGGRAVAPNAQVLIHIQQVETGAALEEVAATDKDGAWFYSHQRFLDSGSYIVWTQLKVGAQISSPSPQLNLTVAPTAIQIGGNRLSYQDFYFILMLIFALAFIALFVFVVYHFYHSRVKGRRLERAVREAEESIRRGFAALRRDIESELSSVRKTRLGRELSFEEKAREEKLLRDLESINNYIGKEVWKIEEAEEEK
jgi:hypothetical protein